MNLDYSFCYLLGFYEFTIIILSVQPVSVYQCEHDSLCLISLMKYKCNCLLNIKVVLPNCKACGSSIRYHIRLVKYFTSKKHVKRTYM